MKARLVFVAAAALLLSALAVGPASAQYIGGTPPDAGASAGPSVDVPGAGAPVGVQVGRTVDVGGFALTGADIAQMLFIAGGMVLGGAVLVRQGRRRVTYSGS